jgi:hypothetical protein
MKPSNDFKRRARTPWSLIAALLFAGMVLIAWLTSSSKPRVLDTAASTAGDEKIGASEQYVAPQTTTMPATMPQPNSSQLPLANPDGPIRSEGVPYEPAFATPEQLARGYWDGSGSVVLPEESPRRRLVALVEAAPPIPDEFKPRNYEQEMPWFGEQARMPEHYQRAPNPFEEKPIATDVSR